MDKNSSTCPSPSGENQPNYQTVLDTLLQPFVRLINDDLLHEFDEFSRHTSKLPADPTNLPDLTLNLCSLMESNMDLRCKIEELQFVDKYIQSANDNLEQQTRKFDELSQLQNFDDFSNTLRQKSSETKFLKLKCAKYQSEIGKLGEEMKKRGFGGGHDWGTVDRLWSDDDKIQKLKDTLRKLEQKQAAYFDLPTDGHLVKVKIEEKRLELKNIENELDELMISSFN